MRISNISILSKLIGECARPQRFLKPLRSFPHEFGVDTNITQQKFWLRFFLVGLSLNPGYL